MNKYEKLELVGEGAYGVVLKCRRKDTGELVAIKTFKGNEESTNVKKTIARELNALTHLRHENIVALKEAFRWKGKLHLVFEYIHRNLLELLEASPAGLDPETVRLCIWQLVKALSYCHRNDIVHRDVKPENLLVNLKTRKLKLCDFGFARQLHESAAVPLTDYVATRWYRSPELLLCDPEYGKPVDMWAVGCIMGELIDGRPLFPGDNEVDQLYKIQLVLGPLLPQHMEMFRQNSRFAGLAFPELPPRETLLLRYRNKFDRTAIDFLSKLLCMDPKARLTAKMALQHPYFKELESADRSACVTIRNVESRSQLQRELRSNTNEIVQSTLPASSCQADRPSGKTTPPEHPKTPQHSDESLQAEQTRRPSQSQERQQSDSREIRISPSSLTSKQPPHLQASDHNQQPCWTSDHKPCTAEGECTYGRTQQAPELLENANVHASRQAYRDATFPSSEWKAPHSISDKSGIPCQQKQSPNAHQGDQATSRQAACQPLHRQQSVLAGQCNTTMQSGLGQVWSVSGHQLQEAEVTSQATQLLRKVSEPTVSREPVSLVPCQDRLASPDPDTTGRPDKMSRKLVAQLEEDGRSYTADCSNGREAEATRMKHLHSVLHLRREKDDVPGSPASFSHHSLWNDRGSPLSPFPAKHAPGIGADDTCGQLAHERPHRVDAEATAADDGIKQYSRVGSNHISQRDASYTQGGGGNGPDVPHSVALFPPVEDGEVAEGAPLPPNMSLPATLLPVKAESTTNLFGSKQTTAHCKSSAEGLPGFSRQHSLHLVYSAYPTHRSAQPDDSVSSHGAASASKTPPDVCGYPSASLFHRDSSESPLQPEHASEQYDSQSKQEIRIAADQNTFGSRCDHVPYEWTGCSPGLRQPSSLSSRPDPCQSGSPVANSMPVQAKRNQLHGVQKHPVQPNSQQASPEQLSESKYPPERPPVSETATGPPVDATGINPSTAHSPTTRGSLLVDQQSGQRTAVRQETRLCISPKPPKRNEESFASSKGSMTERSDGTWTARGSCNHRAFVAAATESSLPCSSPPVTFYGRHTDQLDAKPPGESIVSWKQKDGKVVVGCNRRGRLHSNNSSRSEASKGCANGYSPATIKNARGGPSLSFSSSSGSTSRGDDSSEGRELALADRLGPETKLERRVRGSRHSRALALPKPGNNASGWEIPGVAARSLFNPHDAVRKPRSKDEGKFPPPSRNRQCLQEPDLLQESRRDGPSSQASLVSHAKGCSPVAREPPRGGQATPPTCRSYISPICSPSSSRCITSFGIGSAVKSKTSTGRHQLQGTRAVQSRAIHLAPTAGRALAAERRSFFVDGGAVQIPGELASPIVSKQHPGELPQNRFVPAHDEVGRQLRRKQPDIISSISGAFSLVHTSSIHASSRQRNLQPQIGAHSPKHSGKGAACFKTAPRQSGFGGSAAVVPMGTAAAGRLNASTVIHSPFISGAGTVLPTVLGAAHPPFFGLRSQQRQRGTAEVHGETPGHSMPHQPEVPAISLKTQQKATADCPGSSVEESLPFSPLHAPADKSFAESRRRQRGCVQDSGGAPRPGAVDPDGRQKPSNANPPAQHKRRSADKMLRLGSNGTKAHQTPVLGLQRKQRQLPAAFTPSAAPQPRATGTESYIAEKSDRIDSLRALYAGGFSKRRTGFQGMAMAPGSPSSWQSQDGGMHGNRPGGKETDTGEQPLSLPVGLPLGHKRQKGSSLDKDNSEKAERMLDMAPADITLTKIRDTNFTRLLPLKETRQ